jgi:glycine cleavage system transcriptional repressor
VQGGDKPGIVAAVTKIIAKHQGNITDLTTRLSQSLYLLVAEVSLPTGINLEAINSELVNVGKDFGIALHLTLVEEDVL